MGEPLWEPINGYLRFRNTGKLVHRWAKEKELGRPLEYWEVVHHIDGDRQNNRPENLAVMTAREHYRIHVLSAILLGKAAKFITTGFAVAGAIIFTVGLLTRTKLDLWYIGLVFLIAALAAWYFVLKKNESWCLYTSKHRRPRQGRHKPTDSTGCLQEALRGSALGSRTPTKRSLVHRKQKRRLTCTSRLFQFMRR